MPLTSSWLVMTVTRMASSLLALAARASSWVKQTLPQAAPGEAAEPLAIIVAVFRFDLGVYYVLPCYFAKRLNTHGFRRYALRAYAPMRPAMRSTAVRSVRIRRGENDYFSPRLS